MNHLDIKKKDQIPISKNAVFLHISLDAPKSESTIGNLYSPRPLGKTQRFRLRNTKDSKFAKSISVSKLSEILNISESKSLCLDKNKLNRLMKINIAMGRIRMKSREINIDSEYFLSQKEGGDQSHTKDRAGVEELTILAIPEMFQNKTLNIYATNSEKKGMVNVLGKSQCAKSSIKTTTVNYKGSSLEKPNFKQYSTTVSKEVVKKYSFNSTAPLFIYQRLQTCKNYDKVDSNNGDTNIKIMEFACHL